MTKENYKEEEKKTPRGNFGAKMQTFLIQPNQILHQNTKNNKENYTQGETFGEIKQLKQDFLTGFFTAIFSSENKLTETIKEHNNILQRLHNERRIDIFELNMLESLIFKAVESLKYYFVKSDNIAVNFGGNWKV